MAEPNQTGIGNDLSGSQKAALVLQVLGPDATAAIFKALPEEDLEALTAAMSDALEGSDETRQQALQEFHQQIQRELSGNDVLARVLEKSVGKDKAEMIMSRIRTNRNKGRFFEYLLHMDSEQVVAALRTERPQTLALIFSHLDSKHAAEILGKFDPELQTQVIIRIGHMERVSPEVIAKINATLRKRFSTASTVLQPTGGPKVIAQVLNNVDRDTEKRIFETLQTTDANLLNDIKKLMLVFDDLATLPDTAAQTSLREVEMADLTLALKGASEAMRALISRNLSSRAAERLKEEMELLGPKPRSEVQAAQERVIAVVRRLEEEGKVKLARGGGDDELVA